MWCEGIRASQIGSTSDEAYVQFLKLGGTKCMPHAHEPFLLLCDTSPGFVHRSEKLQMCGDLWACSVDILQ